MKKTIGIAIALMLGASSAIAGGPHGKGQGGPPAHAHSAGPAMRGGGPHVQQHAQPRMQYRGEARAHVRTEHTTRHAQENRATKTITGQAERSERLQGAEKEASKAGENAHIRAYRSTEKSTERLGETSKQASTGDRKEAARHVELSGDKRDRVLAAFREQPNVKHRTNAHVDLRVGRRLPRDWDFLLVPLFVVDIIPEYRDYLFAYVDDDYVICDPETYEIVSIIPASGGPSYARSGERCSSEISLNEDERDLIVRATRHDPKVGVRDLTIGWSVPREIALQTFPDPVVSQVSELSSCRYFVAEDQIAIVSPEQEKVIVLIDRS
jgi:hypothetical protein